MGTFRSIRNAFRTACPVIALALFAFFALPSQSFAADPATPKAPAPSPAQPAALLPGDFAGWQLAGTAKSVTDPAAMDPSSSSVLKECGFTDGSTGDYSRDGAKLALHALRFEDATGAYCAYTFYRHNGWPKEEIGRGGSSDNNRVIFWLGNVVVDANFERITPMSAAELRELAKSLPTPAGNGALPPPLPSYLPPGALESQSTHYAVGPESYTRSGGVFPPSLIDFARGAETLTANYHLHSGDGTLTIISYPTPQLAGDRERAIDAFLKAGNSPQAGWSPSLVESNPASLQVRRSGPYVAVTNGYFSSEDAHRLLGNVNYQAEVTWSQIPISEAGKTARLMLGIFALTGILGGTAILLGLFFGGGRALYRRLRGRPISSMEEVEFISLNLRK
jgi:hypothetical protein